MLTSLSELCLVQLLLYLPAAAAVATVGLDPSFACSCADCKLYSSSLHQSHYNTKHVLNDQVMFRNYSNYPLDW